MRNTTGLCEMLIPSSWIGNRCALVMNESPYLRPRLLKEPNGWKKKSWRRPHSLAPFTERGDRTAVIMAK